jgi:hypothetical protein
MLNLFDVFPQFAVSPVATVPSVVTSDGKREEDQGVLVYMHVSTYVHMYVGMDVYYVHVYYVCMYFYFLFYFID